MSPSVEPFNEAKYKALMDGLECSEVFINNIPKNLFRIEAEYFQKKYQTAEKVLNGYDTLQKYKKKIECGPFGSNLLDSEYKNYGVLVVRPFNLIDCSIENERLVYISDKTVKRNNLKKYPKGALLFSRVGDIKVGYANKDNYTISPNIVIVDFGDEKLSKYASVFFNTHYGKIQIERQLKIAAQPTISTEIVSKLKLPIFNKLLGKVVHIINIKEKCLANAQELYADAERILKENIKIEQIDANEYSIKSFSESFLNSGRLDAEYYQPKYDNLFEALKRIKCKRLGGENGIASIKKSIEPGSEMYQDNGIPFVRVSDVTKFGIEEPKIHLPSSIMKNASELYPKKDTILFSKDGSIGIAYKIEEDSQMITSGALLHLVVTNPHEVLPDYLTLVLNSKAVQLQAERDSNGAIIQHWKPTDIENVIIPILDLGIQQELSSKVKESFALRKKSKELLDVAKRLIEIAIEEDEDIALEWLKDKVEWDEC